MSRRNSKPPVKSPVVWRASRPPFLSRLGGSHLRKENEMFRPTHIRGWNLWRSEFHDKEHWVARRDGVSMNNRTYGGLVNMILTRPY